MGLIMAPVFQMVVTARQIIVHADLEIMDFQIKEYFQILRFHCQILAFLAMHILATDIPMMAIAMIMSFITVVDLTIIQDDFYIPNLSFHQFL